MALPFVAIVTLNADAVGVSLVRSMDLVAGLVVGLVAGAWVDRLRRRPVMIWADLGRAVLLLTIPAAAFGGWIRGPASLIERGLAGLAGGLLCYAAGWADLAGMALLSVVLILHFGRHPLKVGG